MNLKDLLQKVSHTDPPTRLEDVLLMPLSKFRKAGLLCRVPCDHLTGGDYYIASSGKQAAVGRGECNKA